MRISFRERRASLGRCWGRHLHWSTTITIGTEHNMVESTLIKSKPTDFCNAAPTKQISTPRSSNPPQISLMVESETRELFWAPKSSRKYANSTMYIHVMLCVMSVKILAVDNLFWQDSVNSLYFLGPFTVAILKSFAGRVVVRGGRKTTIASPGRMKSKHVDSLHISFPVRRVPLSKLKTNCSYNSRQSGSTVFI